MGMPPVSRFTAVPGKSSRRRGSDARQQNGMPLWGKLRMYALFLTEILCGKGVLNTFLVGVFRKITGPSDTSRCWPGPWAFVVRRLLFADYNGTTVSGRYVQEQKDGHCRDTLIASLMGPTKAQREGDEKKRRAHSA
ncbi:hypothetical protein HPB48_020225 [Haemaphysalis longicornis]|uniref:Uncharacterized protein n=1 Tax=Haemaphysalis longicornis TaxID=44386 RepID=A0A9J6FCM2_HAELO|nr:hypothetical protein HPB48_020225 [Haemaphysalis longicornis]